MNSRFQKLLLTGQKFTQKPRIFHFLDFYSSYAIKGTEKGMTCHLLAIKTASIRSLPTKLICLLYCRYCSCQACLADIAITREGEIINDLYLHFSCMAFHFFVDKPEKFFHFSLELGHTSKKTVCSTALDDSSLCSFFLIGFRKILRIVRHARNRLSRLWCW